MNATQTKSSAKTIIVRSMRSNVAGTMRAEWTEEAATWTRAWAIVRSCGASKAECKAYPVTSTTWVLDILEAA